MLVYTLLLSLVFLDPARAMSSHHAQNQLQIAAPPWRAPRNDGLFVIASGFSSVIASLFCVAICLFSLSYQDKLRIPASPFVFTGPVLARLY